jgi:hypothetical protein
MGPEVSYSDLGMPATVRVIAAAGCLLKHAEIYSEPLVLCYIVQPGA